jgi:glutathione synthase/RimK-type ligase-like ATP-grasp enzyme
VRSIAVATTADAHVDDDWPLLRDALAAEEIDGQLCVWDDETVQWDGYEVVVIRSTWDYIKDRAGFLTWASGVPTLFNRYPIIEYSTDKHYLADLEAKGHRIVPTTFCDVGERATFPNSRFVVKPTVGAGSMDADKYGPDEHDRAYEHVAHLHESGRDAMIQPYVSSIDTAGERALVFIDGEFSHALTKGAMLNVAEDNRDALFRREQMSSASPEAESLDFAEGMLAEPFFDDLLYARADLVLVDEGWAVMELELVEPSLFLTYHDQAAGKLARAIRRRLS